MRNLDNELKNKKIELNKLLEYGFTEEDNQYILRNKIYNNQFEMIIWVVDNKIYSKIIDIENNDEYILVDLQNSAGEFVGKIREEYENKLQDIIKRCTTIDVYKSNQAKEIIKYVKDKYNDELEFLWKKYDDNAVWRNKENNKWYGALLKVVGRKIDIDSDEMVEIIDLRYQKENIKKLIDNKVIFQGYHMNKNSWITIKLDNSMETKKILELIDNSYKISLEK